MTIGREPASGDDVGLGPDARPRATRSPAGRRVLLLVVAAAAFAAALFLAFGDRVRAPESSSVDPESPSAAGAPNAQSADSAALAAAPTRAGSASKETATSGAPVASAPPSTVSGTGVGGRGATVTGIVVDRAGKPVEGAEVDLDRVRPLAIYQRADGAGRWDHLRASTDRDGRFRFERARPAEEYRLRVRAEGYASAVVSGGRGLLPGQSYDVGKIVLAAGITLSGRVTDPEGLPLADVRVVVGPTLPPDVPVLLDDPALFPDPEAATTTGADGRFRFEQLAPGEKSLVARAPSGAAAGLTKVTLAADKPADEITLVLGGAAFVAGRVVDSSGAPIAAARVLAKRLDEPVAHEAVSGADGAFRIERLKPGGYLVGAFAGDLAPRWAPAVAPSDTVRIELPRGGHLVGRVVFAASGKPVSAYALDLEPIGTEGVPDDPMLWPTQRLARDRGPREIRAADGRFDVGPMLAVYYIVRVLVDGHPEAMPKEDSRVAVDAVTDVGTIEVPEARRISGAVVDFDGKPVADASVFVLPADGRTWTPDVISELGDSPDDAIRSDAEGHFESGPLAGGRYALGARRSGGEVSEVAPVLTVGERDVTDARIAFSAKGGDFGVSTFSRSQPAARVTVVLLHESGERVWATTNDAGVYALPGRRVGRWLAAYAGRDAVRAVGSMNSESFERPSPTEAWSALRALTGTVEVMVAARTPASVRIECPPLVRWKATVHVEGADRTSAWLRVEPIDDPDRDVSVHVVNGAFEVASMEPGEYDVRPDGGRGNSDSPHARVTIPDAPTFQSDVVLRK